MISFDRAEALRYMGYRGSEPDAAVGESLTRCAAELQQAVSPKSITARFPLRFLSDTTMQIADVTIESRNLARNLKGCTGVYLMAVTLGVGPDRLITRASAVCMSDAVILQAVAAAMVESCCFRGSLPCNSLTFMPFPSSWLAAGIFLPEHSCFHFIIAQLFQIS